MFGTILAGIVAPAATVLFVTGWLYWMGCRAIDRTAFRYDDPDDWGDQPYTEEN